MNASREFAVLLDELRGGDERASARIVDEYTDALVAVARRQMGSKLARRVDPEDIVQSTYRSLFVRMKQGEYDLGSGRDLWKLLVTITLNKVRRKAKFHRTARRDMNMDQSVAAGVAVSFAEQTRDGGPTPEAAALLVDELQSVLRKVKPRDRQIVELRMQGCSTADIAQEAGRSERSVRRILQHLGEQLRKSIEE
jgi:RNA polymerase sigma-70 factor (ECF subfamily)